MCVALLCQQTHFLGRTLLGRSLLPLAGCVKLSKRNRVRVCPVVLRDDYCVDLMGWNRWLAHQVIDANSQLHPRGEKYPGCMWWCIWLTSVHASGQGGRMAEHVACGDAPLCHWRITPWVHEVFDYASGVSSLSEKKGGPLIRVGSENQH